MLCALGRPDNRLNTNVCAKTFSITTFSIRTLSIRTLSIRTLSIKTLSKRTLSTSCKDRLSLSTRSCKKNLIITAGNTKGGSINVYC